MTKIYAHRGASGYAPENTMVAFEKAVEFGADGIEIDVHLTRDNKIVVTHDEWIARVSNGEGLVRDMTYQELCEFNFAKDRTEFGFQRIPLLSEVFELLRPTNMILNIEVKKNAGWYDGIEKMLVKEAKESGMAERIAYSSFNHYSLGTIKELDSSAFTGALYSNQLFQPWEYLKSIKADAIHPFFYTLFEGDIVPNCKAAGIAVNAWTVDSEEDILKMLSLEVDGIITNLPDLAKKLRDNQAF